MIRKIILFLLFITQTSLALTLDEVNIPRALEGRMSNTDKVESNKDIKKELKTQKAQFVQDVDKTDDEIKAEVAAVLADRERLAQKQREARHSRLNDPARAEEVEKARAALIFEHGKSIPETILYPQELGPSVLCTRQNWREQISQGRGAKILSL